MSPSVRPICRRVFDAQKLVAEFPPRISDRNKKLVYGIACPPGSVHSGQIAFSRWASDGLPATLTGDGARTQFEHREDFFSYDPTPEGIEAVEWHLNFAHSQLFCAYGGSLLAQDELQAAEHPAIGSLREALLQSDLDPVTVKGGEPTPALVRGLERRCKIALDPNAALGRPHGLYGNNFAKATADAVSKATQPITPPTISNLLAMEAPPGGFGRYARKEIEYILRTAYTGFAAAREESRHEKDSVPEVVVHTGFWGCGAYGGNKILMALLQLLAARMAELDRLVFHTGGADGTRAYLRANDAMQEVVASGTRPRALPELVEAMGFAWGESDGN